MTGTKNWTRRVTALMLILALFLGGFSAAGRGLDAVYAAESGEEYTLLEAGAPSKTETVTVRVEGLSGRTALAPVSLSVDSFDLSAFTTPQASVPESGDVLVANALVEAAYYWKHDVDPRLSDLFGEDGLTAEAEAIVEELNLSCGDGGLSMGNSQFGVDAEGWLYARNNETEVGGVGSQVISSGDSLVFFPYIEGQNYSYFDVEAYTSEDGSAELRLYELTDWGAPTEAVSGASILIDGEDSGLLTDENGSAVLSFSSAGEYLISAKKVEDGVNVISKPYCEVTVAKGDTGQDKMILSIEFYDAESGITAFLTEPQILSFDEEDTGLSLLEEYCGQENVLLKGNMLQAITVDGIAYAPAADNEAWGLYANNAESGDWLNGYRPEDGDVYRVVLTTWDYNPASPYNYPVMPNNMDALYWTIAEAREADINVEDANAAAQSGGSQAEIDGAVAALSAEYSKDTYGIHVDGRTIHVDSTTYPYTYTPTIALSAKEAKPGETVYVTVTPVAGRQLTEGSLKANGIALAETDTEGRYSFVMPSENVAILASFEDSKDAANMLLDAVFSLDAEQRNTVALSPAFSKDVTQYALSLFDAELEENFYSNLTFDPASKAQFYYVMDMGMGDDGPTVSPGAVYGHSKVNLFSTYTNGQNHQVRITPAEGLAKTYYFKMTSIPTLSRLSVSAAGQELSFDRPFAYGEGDYTAVVPDGVTRASIAATAFDDYENYVYVNGSECADAVSAEISGTEATTIEIVVTAADDYDDVDGSVANTYTVTLVPESAQVDVLTQTEEIINGILKGEDYGERWYDYNWISAVKAGGYAISEAEKESFLKNVLNDAASAATTSGTKAKIAIALTALNIDATQIPNKTTGEVVDLIREITGFTGTPAAAFDAPYMLMACDLGSYAIAEDARWSRTRLLELILAEQEETGSWGNYVDSTSMVLPALSAYYGKTEETNGVSAASCAAITAAADKALTWLKGQQGAGGGFGQPNSNTTSMVIMALTSLGIDPDGAEFTKAGASALDNLLSFRTDDDRLGFESGGEFDEMASKQGLQALVSYKNYKEGRGGNIYAFNEEVAPYTKWPDAALLTAIIASPAKNRYSPDETIADADLTVKAVYNSDDSAAKPVSPGAYELEYDFSTSGTKKVTVNYRGLTTSYFVTVSGSQQEAAERVTITVKGEKGKYVLPARKMEIEIGKSTVLEVLKAALNQAGKSVTIKNGDYVAEIDGLGEFDEGANSGWMVKVNGTLIETSAAAHTLRGGESIVWFFTEDWTKEPGTKGFSSSEETAEKTSSTVKMEVKVDSAGKATASVDSTAVSAAIKEAAANAKKKGTAAEVVLSLTGDGKARAVEIVFPKGVLLELSKNVDALTLSAALGDVALDKDTLNGLAKASGDGKLCIAKTEDIDGRPAYEIAVSVAGKEITELGGEATISLPYEVAAGENAAALVAARVDENDNRVLIKKSRYHAGAKTLDFSTGHLSAYVIAHNPAKFSDTKSHWSGENIDYLAAREIITGVSADAFAPNARITRAQFVQLLFNSADADFETKRTSAFNDVKADAWYADAVAWAAEKGIVTGIKAEDGALAFMPDANIARQDLAVMLGRYMSSVEGTEFTETNKAVTFADEASIGSYAKDAVSKMQQAGLISGKTPNTFAPSDNATRAEAAKMIALMLQNSL